MDLNLRLQRVSDRVELVSGSIGNPGEGRMCLMSFVAFLAGEAHSDSPSRASPLIQAYAVLINDHMPYDARQRLKPFAPRIIGTNDGLDRERALLLHGVLEREILPRAAAGRAATRVAAAGRESAGFLGLRRFWRWLRRDELQRFLDYGPYHDDETAMASHAARLIAQLARSAPDARERDWYWNAAIGLLDRLCDVGAPTRLPQEVRGDRLAWLEDMLRPRGASAASPPPQAAAAKGVKPPYLPHW
jgi:hypothetical protein